MAVKKTSKNSNSALQQLKADLKAGNPARLYLFFGEEVYLRDSYLQRLKSQLLPPGLEDFNLHILTARECTPLTLSDAIDNLPMMSPRSLVLVQDYDLFKASQEYQSEYAALLSDLPDYVCVIFLYDTIKPDQRTIKGELGKLLKGSPALVNFALQESVDLIPWITARFKELGRDISRTQAEYLIFVTGGTMSALYTEIQKVAAYAKDRTIQKSDIDAVCDPVLEAVTFQMTDQITQGQFEKAMGTLSDLFASQQPAPMIMGALGKQLRQLYGARVAWEQGKSADWLVENLGVTQSWQAERLMRNIRRFSGNWYRNAVRLAAEADRRIKLSYKEEELILTELLIQLAEAAAR